MKPDTERPRLASTHVCECTHTHMPIHTCTHTHSHTSAYMHAWVHSHTYPHIQSLCMVMDSLVIHTHINIWEALLPNATQELLLAQTPHGKQNWETIGKSERSRAKNPGKQQVCFSQTWTGWNVLLGWLWTLHTQTNVKGREGSCWKSLFLIFPFSFLVLFVAPIFPCLINVFVFTILKRKPLACHFLL